MNAKNTELERLIPLNGDNLLCVNINKSLKERPSIYEATRKYWRLNAENARKADYVLGVFHGKVLAVFKPSKWILKQEKEHEVRYEFVGEPVPDSPYLKKHINFSQNPILYVYQKFWLVTSNPNDFNVADCLKKYDDIEWRQNKNFQVGDILLLYLSEGQHRIGYVMEVQAVNLKLKPGQIDRDAEFWSNPPEKPKSKYCILKPIEELHTDSLTRTELVKHGLKSKIKGGVVVKGKLLNYILEHISPLPVSTDKSVSIENLINAYFANWNYINEREEYKWEAVKCFQKHFFDTDVDFPDRIENAISKAGNLLISFRYFAGEMLVEVSRNRPSETEMLITKLFDENQPLKERLPNYMQGFDAIVVDMTEHGHNDWKGHDNVQSYQDTHAASVYLAMRYPEKYYIYKYSIFQRFADIIGYIIQSKMANERYIEYLALCKKIKQELLKNEELTLFYNKWLKKNGYNDKGYTMLTQDFIYAIATHLNSDVSAKVGKKKAIAKTEIETPMAAAPSTLSQHTFVGKMGVDYSKIDQINHELGLQGELWAISYEKERLAKLGIQFKVQHTSVIEGDGKGYDILSVEDDGETPRFIEVKTTTGEADTPFFFSANELTFSSKHKENYHLYRVYNFKAIGKQADIALLQGSLEELHAEPISYKAKIVVNNEGNTK